MKKRMKTITVDNKRSEKNENAVISRTDKKNYINSNIGELSFNILNEDSYENVFIIT